MSTLTFVRHGQANSFQQENGELSPAGEAQAVRLAEFWLRNGIGFDEVYCGMLVRQARTAEAVGECFGPAGRPWPAVERDAAWNEYDATRVMRHFVEADAQVRGLAEEHERARGTPDEKRGFQRLLEAAMSRWLDAPAGTGSFESWPEFRDRVAGAIARLMAGPAGRRIAVFSSGGPIGFAVQHSMQAPARSFLEVNWRVRNTSITEFVFDRSRLTLDSFNALPHLLTDAALLTYR